GADRRLVPRGAGGPPRGHRALPRRPDRRAGRCPLHPADLRERARLLRSLVDGAAPGGGGADRPHPGVHRDRVLSGGPARRGGRTVFRSAPYSLSRRLGGSAPIARYARRKDRRKIGNSPRKPERGGILESEPPVLSGLPRTMDAP